MIYFINTDMNHKGLFIIDKDFYVFNDKRTFFMIIPILHIFYEQKMT